MSGFSDQGGLIRGALIEAGLPAAAATVLANILANGVQTLRHGGDVVHDTTPQGLRQVTPEDRTHRLTNIDSREDDPEYRARQGTASEERKKAEQQSTVLVSVAPQQANAPFRMESGAYTDVVPKGDAAAVNVRMDGAGSCVFRDAANNTLVGKSLRAESDANSRLRFFIESRADEEVFKISLQNLNEPVRVVTNIEYKKGVGFIVQYANLYAWKDEKNPTKTLPVTRHEVVERIYMAGNIIGQKIMVDLLEPSEGGVDVIPVTDCP